MANIRKWSGVAVAMQSALATATTITGITKATPGVVSATHSLANGDYVIMTVQGMHQLNARVFRVVNVVGTTTFQLEDTTTGAGIDTSAFDDFVSGTFQEITFGTAITSATSMSASGGDFDFIDTTTIHSNVKTQIPGSANPITYTFDNLWDIADAGQVAMKLASDLQSQRAFKFTFGQGGPIMVFNGYVGFTGSPGGSAQDKVISPATITAEGSPTYYSA